MPLVVGLLPSSGLDVLPGDRTGRPVGSGRTLSDEQAVHIQRFSTPTALRSWASPARCGIAVPSRA